MRSLKDTIEDCWDQDGDARLTAMTVFERMTELSHHYKDGLTPTPTVNTVQAFQQNFKAHPSISTSSSGLSSMAPADELTVLLTENLDGDGMTTVWDQWLMNSRGHYFESSICLTSMSCWLSCTKVLWGAVDIPGLVQSWVKSLS